MRRYAWILSALSLFLAGSLQTSAQTSPHDATPSPTGRPASQPSATSEAATSSTVPPTSWITERVAEARQRLSSSDAGRLIWASIQAHGGLQDWYAQGALRFRFDYQPLGDRRRNDTVQVVDLWSSRVRHQITEDPEIEFGWSGSEAWVNAPAGQEPALNVRFWALTPYYFVAIPWVLADPGTVLTSAGTEVFEGRTYERVRVGYQTGTGDAPDDYYIVLIDSETRYVGGVRYIVSYPGFFPEGGHSPEKLMSYDQPREVAGFVFPESYRTFALDDHGQPADQVTRTTLTDIGFLRELPADYFDPPAGAAVLEGY